MIGEVDTVYKIMMELREDVIGTDTVWSAGECRPIPLSQAARWAEEGVAVPVLPRGRQRHLTEAPERAVILPYTIPECRSC